MKYTKKLNAGHIATIAAAILTIISFFLPYASSSYNSASLMEAVQEESSIAPLAYIVLGGSILIALFSFFKLNILNIITSLIVALFNFLFFAAFRQESNGDIDFAIGAILMIIASIVMIIAPIVGVCMHCSDKKKFKNGGYATQKPQMQQQFAQPQMQQQFAQPQMQQQFAQPQMQQQFAQPQMQQQFAQPQNPQAYDSANYVNPTAQYGDDEPTMLI